MDVIDKLFIICSQEYDGKKFENELILICYIIYLLYQLPASLWYDLVFFGINYRIFLVSKFKFSFLSKSILKNNNFKNKTKYYFAHKFQEFDHHDICMIEILYIDTCLGHNNNIRRWCLI